jgi:hypothetical protein
MKSKSISSPAGQPSIIPPMAFPCDSPNDVNLNNCPKLFIFLKISFIKTKNVVSRYKIKKQHFTTI